MIWSSPLVCVLSPTYRLDYLNGNSGREEGQKSNEYFEAKFGETAGTGADHF